MYLLSLFTSVGEIVTMSFTFKIILDLKGRQMLTNSKTYTKDITITVIIKCISFKKKTRLQLEMIQKLKSNNSLKVIKILLVSSVYPWFNTRINTTCCPTVQCTPKCGLIRARHRWSVGSCSYPIKLPCRTWALFKTVIISK